jgi:uncharacterized protein (TIGR01777 family)
MQTVGITGGTGFIGHHLSDILLKMGYKVIVFTRDMHKVSRRESVRYTYWNPDKNKFDLSYFDDIVAVINLAGAGIADKRWTEKRKQEIVHSRVHSTEFLIEKLREHAPNCKTLISASAINYYGADRAGAIPFHEDQPAAADFLGTVCKLWEQAAHQADNFLRTVIFRFGIVLGKDEGAFPKFVNPQSFGIMPIIGSGRQVMSWIHINDLINILIWALTHEDVKGTFNAVAPHPVSQKRLMYTIRKEKGGIKIPFHVPNGLLSLMLGEMPKAVMQSVCVSADKLKTAGYEFKFPTIDTAVKNILKHVALDKHNRLNIQKEE